MRKQYEDIIPGYYSNKQRWNSVSANGGIPDDLLMRWLDRSYQLVLKDFSKAKQREILGLSVCGTDCSACPLHGSQCTGCNEACGKVFHAPEGKPCSVYGCCVNKHHYATCASCSQIPCNIWQATRDPSMTDEQFQQSIKHSSKPFNPKLAHVFFISGMIEAWGRGFDKIKAACDALYQTPVPEYDITADGIMVHCKANQRYLELSGQEWVKADDPIMAVFRDDELPIVDAVLKAIDQKGYVKNADVKAIMSKSAATAKRLLSKMVSAHLIKLEGTGRGQRYVKWVK